MQFTVTESAKESSTAVARQDSLLLRVVKTTGLTFNDESLARTSRSEGAKKGGINVRTHPCAAPITGNQFRLVKQTIGQRSLTAWAFYRHI
jgi:hypothetical protein